jgi:murein DD-endopeptidase MepM/ murein hydrolase activator NlpD
MQSMEASHWYAMNVRVLTSVVAALITCLTAHAGTSDLIARFHPSDQVWAHPLESARSIHAILVHNTALINRGSEPITISAVEFQVLRAGEVLATVQLSAAALDRMAQQGSALASSGMMQALDFQFAPARLLGEAQRISDTRSLAPATALLLFHQFLSFKGEADRVRLAVQTSDGAEWVTKELAIRHGAAGTFRFPLEGRWFLGAGATPHSHHRWAVPEEFALDLVQIGADGKTHRNDGSRMEDYYAYGAKVLAIADGEVVKVHDGEADNLTMLRRPNEPLIDYQQRLIEGQGELLSAGADAIVGNHVVIRHADGIHGVYAHLKAGSLKVAAGDKVEVGQHIAALGGSGNSTEPHLHFHLCDAPRALHCQGLPVEFDNIEIPWSEVPRVLQTGDTVLTH